jgi:predicted PurR-regulated permease PerM
VGYVCFMGLFIMRIKFALSLAIIAGVTELIPILGPLIGGALALVVTLATAPEKAIWVLLLYVVVQLLENNLLVPRIQGHYLRIHPAVALFLLVLGAYVAGFWGIVLIVPLAATIVEIYRYLRRTAEKERTVQLPFTTL